jgi:hypothetical protein
VCHVVHAMTAEVQNDKQQHQDHGGHAFAKPTAEMPTRDATSDTGVEIPFPRANENVARFGARLDELREKQGAAHRALEKVPGCQRPSRNPALPWYRPARQLHVLARVRGSHRVPRM